MALRHASQPRTFRKVSVATLIQTMWMNAYSTMRNLYGRTPPKTTNSARRKCLTHLYCHMYALSCRRFVVLHRAVVWSRAIHSTLRRAVRSQIRECFQHVNMQTNKSFSIYVAKRAMISTLLIYLLLLRMPHQSAPKVILGKRLREMQCRMVTTKHLTG